MYKQNPGACWEGYSCVKVVPQGAPSIQGYDDFKPPINKQVKPMGKTTLRPCERTYFTTAGKVTPEMINKLSNSVTGLCSLITSLQTAKEIKEIAAAVNDNLLRFTESC